MKKTLVVILCTAILSTLCACDVTIEDVDAITSRLDVLQEEYEQLDAKYNELMQIVSDRDTVTGKSEKVSSFDSQLSAKANDDNTFDWLDQLAYEDYETSMPINKMTAISAQTKATDGTTYDRGLSFQLNYGNYDGDGIKELNDGTMQCYQTVTYLLDNQYQAFEGFLCTLNTYNSEQHVIITFYGDGERIYTSPILTNGTKSTPFSLDVSNYRVLKIKVEVPNVYHSNGNFDYTTVCIADAKLEKN